MLCSATTLAAMLFLGGTPLIASDQPERVIANAAIQPHMAIHDAGTIYVTFIQKGNICVSISHDQGRTFSESVIAIDVNGRARGGMQRGPRIGVDARKTVTVTAPVTFDDDEYKKKYPTADLFLVSSRDGCKTWTEPLQVNEVSKQAPEALHWMAVAPGGGAHVAWLDRRGREGPGQDIYYTQITDGRVGKNIKIASMVCECCAPGLAVDAKGNPFVAFREGGNKSSREIFATRSTNQGVSFSKPIQINQSRTQEDTCPMSAPAVAVLADGKKFAAAWKDRRTGEPNVFWALSDTPSFSQDDLLHSEMRGEQNHPSLAIDSSGTLWAVWEDNRSGHQQIYARSSSGSHPERSVSAESQGKASFPVVACNAGLVAVAYEAKKNQIDTVVFQLLDGGHSQN